MSNRRNLGFGMVVTAAVTLVLSAVAAVGAPAYAAPGGATIAASPHSGLSDLQVISVSGNAGPLSTVLRGPAGSQTSDAILGVYPLLHVSMCLLPLTASSCDTDLTNFGKAVTTNPATSPHVIDVKPSSTGDWGPINFLGRKNITNGDGSYVCGTGTLQCVIGSANAPRPTDHSYDAIQDLTFTAPEPTATATTPSATSSTTATRAPSATPSASASTTSGSLRISYTPTVVVDGMTISVSGSAGRPNAPALYVAACESTPTATNCDQSLEDFGTPTTHILQVTPNRTTGAWGPVKFYVRQHLVTGDHDVAPGFDCKAAGTCVIGTTNSVNPKDRAYNVTAPLNFSAASVPTLPDALPAADAALTVGDAALTAGGRTTVSGAGFAPQTPVVVGIYSSPTKLSTVTTDSTGAFTASVKLPKGLSGAHTLAAIGTTQAGASWTLTRAVTITAAVTTRPTPGMTTTPGTGGSGSGSGNGGTLAATGATVGAMAPLVGGAGLALLLLGLILLAGTGGTASRRH